MTWLPAAVHLRVWGRLRCVSWLVLAHLAASPALARPAGERVNVREACRQEVAGIFLEAYDAWQKARSFRVALERSEKDMRKAAGDADKAAKALADQARQQAFDIDLAVRRDHASARALSLAASADEQLRQGEQAAKDAKRLEDEQLLLEAEIRKVFVIDRTLDQQDGGYPLAITFRSSCPPYRHLCPLPRADREALLNLTLPGGLPDSCRRYAGLSAIPLP